VFRDPGRGATNASIGVHTAFQDSTPMVLFVGDVASDTRDREAFQEVDYGSFFGPSTKGMAKRVERIDDAGASRSTWRVPSPPR
jgi:acetolactate synthase-1/2/3 large subunit